MRKFLLAEDDQAQMELLKSILVRQYVDAEIREAFDGGDALKLLDGFEPDVVITDYQMPNLNGQQLAQLSKQRYPDTKIVLLSSVADTLPKHPCIDFSLSKPYTSANLFKTMIMALEGK